MIRSMTGFGRGEATDERYHATAEARSVNNRFCEIRVRMPRLLSAYEAEATSAAKAVLPRGKIDIVLQLTQQEEVDLGLSVNVPVAKAYARLLQQVIEATGVEDHVRLEHLQAYSDIFDKEPQADGEADRAWDVARVALLGAVDALQAMREQEGDTLRADLELRVTTIMTELEGVEARAPQRVVESRDRLRERLVEVLGDDRIDADRLEFEMALLAERLDVTEECVRLRSHVAQFQEALTLDEPVGRRLNFLAQEMNREVNTIGSKANDAEIAYRAVRMKEALEQIREQINNVQ